jgi:Flp pilus assembly pilin Flp
MTVSKSNTQFTRQRRSRLSRGSRGAVLVEYAFLLTAVAIPVMIGITAGGVAMLKEYRTARTSLMAPIP